MQSRTANKKKEVLQGFAFHPKIVSTSTCTGKLWCNGALQKQQHQQQQQRIKKDHTLSEFNLPLNFELIRLMIFWRYSLVV